MARTKHPELTRAALLDAARRVVRTHGAALSLEAVAREAGVSKGGLLHHFPSKEHLLSAMAHALVEQFQADLEAAVANEVAQHGPTPGKWLRAYIELSFSENEEFLALSAALAPLAALPVVMRRLQEAQRFVITEAEGDGIPVGRAHAVRLACDGLLFGPQVGVPDLGDTQRKALKEELVAWTRL